MFGLENYGGWKLSIQFILLLHYGRMLLVNVFMVSHACGIACCDQKNNK